jgi:DNA-binding beta-propeller fold protein YncE
MKNKNVLTSLLALTLFITTFAFTDLTVRAGDIASVNVFNAEDLAPLEGGHWVIASSMLGGVQARGGIYLIDARSGSAQKIYPTDTNVGATKMADCTAQVTAEEFAPHGIALHKDTSGVTQLYVVNHGGRESIEIFEVEQHSTPSLRWIGCVIAPAGVLGNAVAISTDGTVFETNMGKPLDGSAAVSPMGGDVISWNAATGWRDIPGSAIKAPNGLLVSPNGRELYVASWTQGEVIALTLKGDTKNSSTVTRKVLKTTFLPDNLRWSSNGNIFAAGHRTSVEAVSTCFMSTTRCNDPIPSAISEIDPKSLTTRCIRNVDQSMATTAINVGDEIWLGTARGDSILRLPANALATPNCE